MVDEALKCLNFEVKVDATVREQRTVHNGSSSGSWQTRGTVPIDHTGFNFAGTLGLAAFTYSSATDYHCADGSMATLNTAHDGQAAAGTMGAVLMMDLNPREPAPAGQPAPDPPQDSLTLTFSSGPKERYRSWWVGCENDPNDFEYGENTRWRSLFLSFHGGSSVLELPIERSATPVEVLHTEIFGRSRTDTSGTASEETYIELWHTPKN